MRISAAWTLLALAWTASAQSLNATTNSSFPVISIDDDPQGARDITAWALIYTYPFAIFANVVGGILRGNGTVNALVNQRYLASPGETGVIKRALRWRGRADGSANVDVLYSRVALDLSQNDLILTIPSVPSSRYAVFPVYAPSGDVVRDRLACAG